MNHAHTPFVPCLTCPNIPRVLARVRIMALLPHDTRKVAAA
jgi:hypothetical protein